MGAPYIYIYDIGRLRVNTSIVVSTVIEVVCGDGICIAYYTSI